MVLITVKVSLSSLVFPEFQPGSGSGDGVAGEGVEREMRGPICTAVASFPPFAR